MEGRKEALMFGITRCILPVHATKEDAFAMHHYPEQKLSLTLAAFATFISSHAIMLSFASSPAAVYHFLHQQLRPLASSPTWPRCRAVELQHHHWCEYCR
jgi:hypothetical protein